jgi:GNAT superfamily N-acetyltransferase
MADQLLPPELVMSWLYARSVARSLPAPIRDRGGFRVETNSEKEVRRWVFPQLDAGIRQVGIEAALPRHFVKLCGTDADLRNQLPANWTMLPASYFMMAGAVDHPSRPLPAGYTLQRSRKDRTVSVRVNAPNGSLAASGHAAEAAGVFIYDRIETEPEHRRRGLGNAVMKALSTERSSSDAPQLLVATEIGRELYTTLGWRVLSPYATATIAS